MNGSFIVFTHCKVRFKNERGYLQAALLSRGVACEERQLALGDVMWVARYNKVHTVWKSNKVESKLHTCPVENTPRLLLVLFIVKLSVAHWVLMKLTCAQGLRDVDPSLSSSAPELVLHFIVERKRVDDLASSIRDGRYCVHTCPAHSAHHPCKVRSLITAHVCWTGTGSRSTDCEKAALPTCTTSWRVL